MSFWERHAEDRLGFEADLLAEGVWEDGPEQLELFDHYDDGLDFGEWMEGLPR